MSKTLVLIPSRLAATRLPGKPLLKINGKSIISHVYKRAIESEVGLVFVATSDKEIFEDVVANGGKCILTSNKHKTGTDRIYEAYTKLNLKNIDYVLNLQGDEPLIDKEDIINLNNQVVSNELDFCTLGCLIKNKKQFDDKNIVKVKTREKLNENNFQKAEIFFRKNQNFESENVYHHIGVYQYKVSTLKKFTSLIQSNNEKKHNLEQLRALDNKIEINIVLAKSPPIGIDTKDDYQKVKNLMER